MLIVPHWEVVNLFPQGMLVTDLVGNNWIGLVIATFFS